MPWRRRVAQKQVYSHHAGDELVDLLLAVAPNTASLERVALLLKALERRAELEGPEEVVGLLEGVTNSPNLVDQILDAGNALLTEDTSDDRVVIESNSLSVDLTEASLVDEFADGVASGVTIGDIRLDHADHVDGGAVELDEDAVVELSKSEELHDLLLLGWQLVNTK